MFDCISTHLLDFVYCFLDFALHFGFSVFQFYILGSLIFRNPNVFFTIFFYLLTCVPFDPFSCLTDTKLINRLEVLNLGTGLPNTERWTSTYQKNHGKHRWWAHQTIASANFLPRCLTEYVCASHSPVNVSSFFFSSWKKVFENFTVTLLEEGLVT